MVKGAKVCAILSCKAQNDKEHGKQGGFFSLPSLEKKRDLRQLWVNQARLPEAYMKTPCNRRICFRHFQSSDFDTSGQRLTIIIGKVLSLLEACLDLISSPSTSMKIQIMGGKVTENPRSGRSNCFVLFLFIFKKLLFF